MEAPTLSAEDFARGYAERSGVTVEWLKEHGREAMPCDCEEDCCESWQMGRPDPLDAKLLPAAEVPIQGEKPSKGTKMLETEYRA